MRIAAEEYLLINFLMDFLFLYLASRGTWFFHLGRLSAASFFAAAYALLDAMVKLNGGIDALALLAAVLIAFRFGNLRLFIKTAFLSVAGLMILGSAVRLFMEKGGGTLASGALGTIMGCACVSAAKSGFRASGINRLACFRVQYAGEKAEFTAIIDTGNLLTEPMSSLPVLIADERALGKSFVKKALSDASLRQAAYASVGGGGCLKCLRTDKTEVNYAGRWVQAPDMWLGLYPGIMSGGAHALAPGTAVSCGKRKRTEGGL